MSADIQLKATVSNIVRFERETGLSLITAFNAENMSITVVIDLVKALSNASDEQIDTFVAEEGFEALSVKMTEALKDGGFLPKEEQPAQTLPKK